MNYHIKDFSAENVQSAVELFLRSYMREKEINTLMPDKIITDPQLISHSLNSQAKNPGVAVFSNNTLIAYMLTGATFTFKNQKAAMISEYGHSAINEDRRELYRLMYMKLSSRWIQQNIHLHIIGHFAHDERLNDILFQLGFGAILSEKLRDLSPVANAPNMVIKVEKDPLKILKLDQELRQYARDVPAGYFAVGASNNTREGFLLQDTNTAQVKFAFIKPSFRGKGAGTALLNEAIKWARNNSFKRVFVEHETANYYGGKFWEKHFSSYLYFSIRYIDNTI
jgi:GNAT superfamily N-acetyltransferase